MTITYRPSEHGESAAVRLAFDPPHSTLLRPSILGTAVPFLQLHIAISSDPASSPSTAQHRTAQHMAAMSIIPHHTTFFHRARDPLARRKGVLHLLVGTGKDRLEWTGLADSGQGRGQNTTHEIADMISFATIFLVAGRQEISYTSFDTSRACIGMDGGTVCMIRRGSCCDESRYLEYQSPISVVIFS